MNTKKKLLIVLILVLILGSVIAGFVWHSENYHVVDFRSYPKNTLKLDLREEEISVSHYEKLREKMPVCEIRWKVPLGEMRVPNDTRELTVTGLTEEDLKALAYLPDLETVHAENCTEYALLAELYRERPDLKVEYSVAFSDGSVCPCDSREVELSSVAETDIALIQYMPELKHVTLVGRADTSTVEALRAMADNCGADFAVGMGDQRIPANVTQVEVTGATDADLAMLPMLENLNSLHLQDPEAAPETVLALRETYPDMRITWAVDIGGQVFDDTVTEVDLSKVEITDLAMVEKKMAYLPAAEKLIFGLCGIDNPDWGNSRSKLVASPIENEDLFAYRDRVREDYKVVWTVRLGPSIALRTDKDNFMPNHFGVGRLFNDYAYNLKYCEDMVCLDLGHMTLTDIFFVEYMPKLKYLILAWTEVQYIEPIRSCKNLIWLELDWSCIRDYSPLVDCTALEDLNLGSTFCDITPILEMTWLKNLYMIYGNRGDAWKATQALPNTRVVASGDATVGGGWRRLPNYYDMRDMLGMYYMN